jgi:hypothetical protein
MSLQVLLAAAEERLKASLAIFSASVGANIGCTHLRSSNPATSFQGIQISIICDIPSCVLWRRSLSFATPETLVLSIDRIAAPEFYDHP